MQQIYYTQCPIGYGLGASNGFQIKRMTPKYSLSSDFRHLGLRAFPAGGRTLAPPSLRYRRVEGNAEVAWLTPRAQEYETERGLWGRPGGHFAHGLTLDPAELLAIGDWPAGLYDRPFWRRSDPEPSRGKPPDPVDLAISGTFAPMSLEGVAPLASGVDPEWLARLLTALAAVARERRTLFLIDEPDRLGPMVALLTFLFPPPLRADLTFSTYHDRPEELPGYRLHGMTHGSRPNRAVLLTQGIIADARTSTIEPAISVAEWSRALVNWLQTGDEASRTDFARHVATSDGPDRWDDVRLDRLVKFGQALRSDTDAVDWSGTLGLLNWAAEANLTDAWLEAHDPSWWMKAEPGAPEGRSALLTLSGWPVSWRGGRASAWGLAVGRWFAATTPSEIEGGTLDFALNAPTDRDRLDFLLAIRRDLPKSVWKAIRHRIASMQPPGDSILNALELPEALASAAAGRSEPLRELARVFDQSSASAGFFQDLIAAEADRDGLPIARIADGLTAHFDRPKSFARALGRGDEAFDWLHVFLRHHLATPGRDDRFQALLNMTPTELRPTLARSLLIVASDAGLSETAFTSVVEEQLLALAEAERPHDPSWPGLYLDRSPSDLDLVRKLYARGPSSAGLKGWLKSAGTRGELGEDHRQRISRLAAIARTLNARDPGPIEAVDLARVPGRDRGPLLARWLAQEPPDPTVLLAQCAESWGDSLRDDSPDFESLARAIAGSPLLATVENDPETWFHRLAEIRRHLAPSTPASMAFGPAGLVARVVAIATRAVDRPRHVWSLLEQLLNDEAGWRTIAPAFRLDLDAAEPAEAASVVGQWDKNLFKRRPSQFWEVALNVCDGPRLAVVVSARSGDLLTLGHLAWWDHRQHPEASDDLRDAFARLIPLGPLEESALKDVESWIKSDVSVLSEPGRARWTCIDRLTRDVEAKELKNIDRRFKIREWPKLIDLSTLSDDDRYGLVARVIFKLDDPSALDVNPISKWLVRAGLTDLARIDRWYVELSGLVDVSDSLIRDREELARKLRVEMRLVIRDDEESERMKIHVDPS